MTLGSHQVSDLGIFCNRTEHGGLKVQRKVASRMQWRMKPLSWSSASTAAVVGTSRYRRFGSSFIRIRLIVGWGTCGVMSAVILTTRHLYLGILASNASGPATWRS